MGNTPILALPYPANTDPLANVAAAIQALAMAIEGQLAKPYAKGSFRNTAGVVGVNTPILFPEIEDTHNAYNPATGIFTVPNGGAGVYRVTGAVKIAGSTMPVLSLEKSGTVVGYGPNRPNQAFGGFTDVFYIRCAVGDTLRLMCKGATYTTQNDGGVVDNNFVVFERVRA